MKMEKPAIIRTYSPENRRDLRKTFIRTAIMLSMFLGMTGLLRGAEQEIENIEIVNWLGEDYAPILSPDGRYLFFQSDRPGSGEQSNLWMSMNPEFKDRLGPAKWTVPIPLHFPPFGNPSATMKLDRPAGSDPSSNGTFTVNGDGFEGMPAILFEGSNPVALFFTGEASSESGRDGYDGLNIYFTKFADDRWSLPRHINEINSHFNDRMPAISEDGKVIYFSSDRPGGYGGYDIWFSQSDESGRWREPVNAGPEINSAYNENAPVFAPGGKRLFFSSDRPGGLGHFDIYVSKTDGFSWSIPENLGHPFNSPRDDEYMTVTGFGTWAYFSSDRRSIYAKGGFDIYRTILPEWLKDSVEILVTGLILDGRTRKPLGIEATIEILYEKETVVGTSSVFRGEKGRDYEGNFAVKLESDRFYRMRFSAPGFYPAELSLDYRGNIPPDRIDRRVVVLQPIRPDKGETEEFRLIQGRVVDDDTNLSLPGSDVQYALDGGNNRSADVNSVGEFVLKIPSGSSFTLYATAPGYLPERLTLQERSDLKEIEIRLKKDVRGAICPGDDPKCIDNIRIYFALDSSKIDDSEKVKLDAILRVLRANPKLRIEIQGHTDRSYRGPKDLAYEYNLRLSNQRAKAVRDSLVQPDIAGERLVLRGYSYLKPRIKEAPADKRGLNRRVEFRRIRE